MKKTLTILAAATLGIAAPAFAGTGAIDYSDLDLDTAEGRDMLERRIDMVAKEACGLDRTATGTRLQSRAAKACYKDVRLQVDRQIAAKIGSTKQGG